MSTCSENTIWIDRLVTVTTADVERVVAATLDSHPDLTWRGWYVSDQDERDVVPSAGWCVVLESAPYKLGRLVKYAIADAYGMRVRLETEIPEDEICENVTVWVFRDRPDLTVGVVRELAERAIAGCERDGLVPLGAWPRIEVWNPDEWPLAVEVAGLGEPAGPAVARRVRAAVGSTLRVRAFVGYDCPQID
ncbi:hypothetical protein [Gordonia sp. NPDC003585]|uniref:hypothetical protein n=1 Tax=Gordonia sp. NPDC003585 TaxID=3154275 RepID=UPI0033BA762A